MTSRTLLQAVVELVFPARCIYCRRIGSDFCHKCRSTAQFVGENICIRCGQPTTKRCTCRACRLRGPDSLHGMRGAVFYGGPVAFAIHGLKYLGRTQLALPLASYLIAYLEAHPIPIDYLVPVPLHPERLAFRGYNQSVLLAEAVSRTRKIPVRPDLVERTRATPPQVQLNRRQRQENMNGAFAPLAQHVLHGETVLVIDDVCTTGATLRACAQALSQAGAGQVWALTIARAHPKTDPEPWQDGLGPDEVFQAWDGDQYFSSEQET